MPMTIQVRSSRRERSSGESKRHSAYLAPEGGGAQRCRKNLRSPAAPALNAGRVRPAQDGLCAWNKKGRSIALLPSLTDASSAQPI